MGSNHKHVNSYNAFINWVSVALRLLNSLNPFDLSTNKSCQPIYDKTVYDLFKSLYFLLLFDTFNKKYIFVRSMDYIRVTLIINDYV